MIVRDFVHAGRLLRSSPGFAITTVATIAMGIAASAAVFSVTHAVLLRPLPYKNPDRLVIACHDMIKRDVKDFTLSNASFFDLRDQAKDNFVEFGAVRTGRNIMPTADGTPEQIRLAQVTPNFLRMMGAKIELGRDFADEDGVPQPPPAQAGAFDAPPPLPMIAILSHEFFQRRYGGNREILGHGMLQNGAGGPQIVGVLAPGFELLFPPQNNMEQAPDVWLAARLSYDAARRVTVTLRVIGRLKDGVSLEQAQAEVDAFSEYERRQDPIEMTSGFHIRLEPMQRHLVAAVRPAILAISGAVMSLWLIACANVANLILVRNSVRERELAVRAALGAHRCDLIRQILAEALLLAGLGTAAGLGLAWAGIRALRSVAPPRLPRLDEIAMDPAVVGFAALAGLAAAALFGLLPAFRAARTDLMRVLGASSRTAGIGGSPRLRNCVVIAEVALTFVLLIGSGLMVRSYAALQQIDPGHAPKNLLTFQLMGGGADDPRRRAAFIRQVQSALLEVPGVQSATASFPFPPAGGFSPIRWGLESARSDPSNFQAADYQAVLPGYFDTLRTSLIAGRTFSDADNAPDRNVVIIDQMLAAKAFPGIPAVGKHFDSYVRAYEERFEARAGPLRPVVVRSVEAFLDCGRLQGGFASFTAPTATAPEPPFRPPMMATPSLWQTQTGSRTIPIIPGKPGARGRAC
jgi:putative ABC transport system permease protein